MAGGVIGTRSGGFRRAVAFLTPVGGAAEPAPEALFWFPAVGAVIGATVGGVWWTAAQLWPAPVAAALAVVADLACTGMLHFDGLCDTADGLLAPMSRERRLAVMATPEVGAFGVAVALGVLLLRWVSLASLDPSPVLLAAVWAASRTWMAATIVAVPYARAGGGLASAFQVREAKGVLLLVAFCGLAASALLAAAWRPLIGPTAILGATAAAAGVVALARRRLGGFTGDVLGAAGVIGETVGLLLACARW